MSTFGKKALNNWKYQYSEENFQRFNRTPIEIQLEILEKWYPIGMECNKYDKFFKKYQNGKHVITGYEIIGAGTIYHIELDMSLFTDKSGNYFKQRVTGSPLSFKPTEEWFKQMNRENKLNDLLG